MKVKRVGAAAAKPVPAQDNQAELAALAKLLEWSDGFSLAFAACDFPPERDRLIADLRQTVGPLGVELAVVDITDQEVANLRLALQEYLAKVYPQGRPPRLALCIVGLEASIAAQRARARRPQQERHPTVLAAMNFERELFALDFPFPLVIWLPEYALTYLAQGAPDFWAWHGAIFRFRAEAPAVERAMAEAVYAAPYATDVDKARRRRLIDVLLTLLHYYEAPEKQDRRALEARGHILSELGEHHLVIGDAKEAMAYYRQALAISREIGDRQGEGSALGNLGSAYFSLGRYQEAIEHHKQALAISREIGDRRGEGSDLGNLGLAYRALGRYQEAIEYFQQALAIAREIGDRRGEGSDLGNLGSAYFSLGRYQEAIEHFKQALAIAREIGDRRGEGSVLGNLGTAYGALGRYQEAMEHHKQALALAREIGDRGMEGSALGNLGLAYYALGRYQEAMEHYRQALAIAREIGDRRGEGRDLGNLGLAYDSLGRYQEAIEHHKQALVISREIGDRRGEARYLGNLGRAYYSLGRYQEAIEHHQQALAISREIGDRRMEGNALGNLGLAYAALGQDYLVPALACILRAGEIFRDIGAPEAAKTADDLARLRRKLGQKPFQELEARVGHRMDEILMRVKGKG